ncbi:unnamed protein product [Camellia sinensis]
MLKMHLRGALQLHESQQVLIMRTLVRYPFVNLSVAVRNTTGNSLLRLFGPCSKTMKSGYNNSLAKQAHVAPVIFFDNAHEHDEGADDKIDLGAHLQTLG